ncbi:unnamed protein product [Sphenostylis stenocarpa]|uniref:Uncharacterized protein n=1 Tax=Sphenostylis stenocarpa TaxID=92480 RepID=A0AA86SR66_9FABA|nr:unnamed protein product [Sphenostylis stenocarpa]
MEERMKNGGMEENICYSKLTSFLQKDTSFLTPWSWDANASDNEASTSTKQVQYLQFPPGSYFSFCICRWLNFKKRKKPRNYDYLRTSENEKRMMEIKARIKKKLRLVRRFYRGE